MTKDIQQRIRRLRAAEQRLVPDAAWVKQTRQDLILHIENSVSLEHATPSQWKTTLRAVRDVVPASAAQWIRRPMVAMATLVTMLAGGSVLSVSAAETSLPGDFFYGLKLATEQARIALTATSGDKLKLKAEFTDRRVDELKYVVDTKNDEQVVQVAELLKRDLDTMKQQLGDVAHQETNEHAVTAAKLVDQKTSQVVVAIQETKSLMSPENKEKMTEVQSVAADAGAKALEVLVEKHDQANVDSVTEVAKAIEDHAKLVASVTSTTQPFIVTVPTSTSTSLTMVLPVSSASSSGSTLLANLIATTTTTPGGVSQVLPEIVDRVKDATKQAFDQQKIQDLGVTSSTASTDPNVVPTTAATGTAPAVTPAKVTDGAPQAGSSAATGTTPTPNSTSDPTKK